MKTLLGATALLLAASLAPTASPAADASPAPAPHVAAPRTAAPRPRTATAAPRTVLDVADLTQGPAPTVAWSERVRGVTSIHGADGTTTPAPGPLGALAPMGSGFVVQTGAGRTTTRWIASDGSFGRYAWRTGPGLAVSPLGRAVAFAGRQGRVWSIDQEGDRVLRFARVHLSGTGRAVSVAGENCQEGGGDPGYGCSVVVNGARRAEYTTSHGIADRVPHVRQVTTGRGRLLGGVTSVSDTGSCSALMRDLRVRWRTCDDQLSDISPDHRHVLGTPAYADGFGPTVLRVLSTRDGSVITSFTAARDGRSATYFDEVWEDATHVLVVTYQAGEWAVVRLGVDGSMEYAVAPRAGSSDLRAPLRLQTR